MPFGWQTTKSWFAWRAPARDVCRTSNAFWFIDRLQSKSKAKRIQPSGWINEKKIWNVHRIKKKKKGIQKYWINCSLCDTLRLFAAIQMTEIHSIHINAHHIAALFYFVFSIAIIKNCGLSLDLTHESPKKNALKCAAYLLHKNVSFSFCAETTSLWSIRWDIDSPTAPPLPLLSISLPLLRSSSLAPSHTHPP